MSPLSALHLMVGDNFFNDLARQTNIYAAQTLNTPWESSSHQKPWYDVDPNELKNFFALVLVMGLSLKPRFVDFWSTKAYFHCPFFGESMPRDRFEKILRFLHVVDNRNPNSSFSPQDPLWKLRPFVDMISSQFKAI